INVIAVRAGAARLRHREEPDRSLAALEAIEDLARCTAGEIDHIVGALRDRPASGQVETPPGLASLDTLVGQHAGTRLTIGRTTTEPPRRIASALDKAAYRMDQEALTNAPRHGAGTAQVDIAFGDTALDVVVTNPVRSPGRPPSINGHGLVG